MEQSRGGRARAWAEDALVRFAGEIGDSFRERRDRPGYHEAADLAVAVVDEHIAALDEKVESGTKVTQQEHYLNKKLRDLKKEMQQALEDRWESPHCG
jgi:hypothetical protein